VSFTAPWALFGLLLLPVLWWILRRARVPDVRVLPTLMFLTDEDERVHAARARQIDVDAILALFALGLLVLAASGPQWVWREAGHTVRVVVAGAPRAVRPATASVSKPRSPTCERRLGLRTGSSSSPSPSATCRPARPGLRSTSCSVLRARCPPGCGSSRGPSGRSSSGRSSCCRSWPPPDG